MLRLLALIVCLGLFIVAEDGLAQQPPDQQEGDGIPDGLKALKHPSSQVRYNAVELLGKLGKSARFAVPHLKDMLQDSSVAVRIKTVESLWKIEQPDPKPLLPILEEAMEHKENVVRSAALNVLGQFGEKAKSALPAVKKALKDESFNVRFQAVLAVRAMGPVARDAIPELLDIIRADDTGFLEAQATITLGKIGAGAVKSLGQALTDKNAKVRRGAAFALGLIGPKAYESVPGLVHALKDQEALVRSFAAEALGKIGAEAESAKPELARALKDQDGMVQVNAALALWRIDRDKDGIAVLASALARYEDSQVRATAAAALAEIGPAAQPALPQLAAALKDKDEDVRREAVIALSKLGPAAASDVPKIQPLFEDKNSDVRLQSVLAVWRIEKKLSEKGLKVLKQGLEQEEPEDVLLTIRVLEEIGSAAKPAGPVLLELLLHRNEEIRISALNALKKIDPQSILKKGNK